MPYGYHSKTNSTQFILVPRRNCFIVTSSNAHGCSRFSGLSQTIFDTDNRPVAVDESTQSCPSANLSHPAWDVNAQSSSWSDPVSLWTGPLMNGDQKSNVAPTRRCQSTNLNLDFAFGPLADFHDFAGPYLAPPLDYQVADSNLNAQFPRFEASSGTMFDTSLGYAMPNELFPQITSTIIEPKDLTEYNDYFPKAQSRNPNDESISSAISSTNHDDHQPVSLNSAFPNTCMECSQSFEFARQLFYHCTDESHAAFMCTCGERFTRSDVLNRHVNTHQPEPPKYQCPYCKSRRGGKSFKRKDHLTQHIRGYHHIGTESSDSSGFHLCPHSNCEQYREPAYIDSLGLNIYGSSPFLNLKEFTKHMRTVHDDTPYPCDVSGCSRVRGKGYLRRMDLIKHRKREHPDAPKFKALHSCRVPDCLGIGESFLDMRDHYMKEHGHSRSFANGLAQWWLY